MKFEKQDLIYGLKRVTNYSEGLTSLIAGTYVLSLAVTKRNMALRIALGIAGGYLILRSGSKLHSGSFDDEIL
ncbi:hypothetical protein [Algoriphagus persicinus]|uniref:hypothetical protein n=1 Tax=Algoriphagus persicinus TaxID=3108754 RepID=UPI002B3EA561|nr:MULTISPECIES: hypothetical protein [unclassified Algoriphagus]MEB2782359.1 hypothetical protein [Algoriphagus sp. C2-6-M1]MEB2786138.1 hypothetical protein [Algoriphagus sp. E1-3-M2]